MAIPSESLGTELRDRKEGGALWNMMGTANPLKGSDAENTTTHPLLPPQQYIGTRKVAQGVDAPRADLVQRVRPVQKRELVLEGT